MKFKNFQGNAAKWISCWLCILGSGRRKKWAGIGVDLHRNYGMVVLLLCFPCSYDNLTLKLHQEKRSSPEGWLFVDRFKVESVPGMSVALESSIKVSKFIMSLMQHH